jgi:hypothetical protein
MLKKSITYTDLNGNERTEDFYFNLTRSEIAEMEMSTSGGLVEKINRIVAAQDGGEIIKFFKTFLLKAYGEKHSDGVHFVKNDEVSAMFACTGAYDVLFMELITNPDKAAAFLNAVVPPAPETEETK